MRRRCRAPRSQRPRPAGLCARAVSVALIAAALTVAAGGCGAEVRLGRSRMLEVAISDFHLAPVSASVPPGRLTVLAHNYGRLSHNIAIERAGRQIASTSPLPPGTSARLIVNLAPGDYVLLSTSWDGAALGARATLIVR